MSRYELAARSGSLSAPNLEIAAGWDAPLRTFYLQVKDLDREREDPDGDPILVWLGTRDMEITDIDEFVAQLERYATVAPDLRNKLVRDQRADFRPARHRLTLAF